MSEPLRRRDRVRDAMSTGGRGRLFASPDESLGSVRDRWLVILLCTAAAVAIGLAMNLATPSSFAATAEISLAIQPTSNRPSDVDDAERAARVLAVRYAALAQTSDFVTAASPHADLRRVQAFAVTATPLVRIITTGSTADEARDLGTRLTAAVRTAYSAEGPGRTATVMTPAETRVVETTLSPSGAVGVGAVLGAGVGLFIAFFLGPRPRKNARRGRSQK